MRSATRSSFFLLSSSSWCVPLHSFDAFEGKLQGAQRGPRYDLNLVWTDGKHEDRHPGALLPEGLRWLWRSHRGKQAE